MSLEFDEQHTIPFRRVDLNASIFGEIPFAVFTRRPLTGKSSTTKRLDVERSTETARLLADLKVRLEKQCLISTLYVIAQ